MKYLRMNLTKGMKEPYPEKQKAMMRESEEYLNTLER